MLCFSATCNAFVRACLSRVLALRSARIFDASTAARKPVSIRLHFPGRSGKCPCCSWGRGRDASEVVAAARGHGRGEVLVFTSSRASCDDLRAMIARENAGVVVEVYHAGLADEDRQEIQVSLCQWTAVFLDCSCDTPMSQARQTSKT